MSPVPSVRRPLVRTLRATLAVVVGLVVFLDPGTVGVRGPVARAANALPPQPVVSGNRLLDAATGTPLRVAGVNRSGAEYACVQGWGIFDGPVDDTAVAAIASWGTNAVRLPLNEDCWLGINGVSPTYGGTAYRTAIGDLVARLHAHGLAVVLDALERTRLDARHGAGDRAGRRPRARLLVQRFRAVPVGPVGDVRAVQRAA